MKPQITPLLLSLPFLLSAAPVQDATRSDVRCFIVVSSLADSNDDAAKTAGMMGTEYYLGRIDGRSPGLDLEAAVARELPISATHNANLLRSCGALMQKRGSEVEAVGRRLQAK